MSPRLFNPMRERLRELRRLSGIEEAAPIEEAALKKSLLDTFDEDWDKRIVPDVARGVVGGAEKALGIHLHGAIQKIEAVLRQKDCPIRKIVRDSVEQVAGMKAGKVGIGDYVKVTTGEFKGAMGKVIAIYPADGVMVNIDDPPRGEILFRDFDKRLKVVQ